MAECADIPSVFNFVSVTGENVCDCELSELISSDLWFHPQKRTKRAADEAFLAARRRWLELLVL